MAAKSKSAVQGLRQQTLKNSIHCAGVGLHSGRKVNMTLHPAEPDSGIIFRRSDVGGEASSVPAHWRHAVETPLCTTLVGDDDMRIMTIEHLMSALAGCGIDNALIELNGPEVPIMDGSAAPFVFLIECAGISDQDAPRRAIRIKKEVVCSEPHRSAALMPGKGYSLDFEIAFEGTVIGEQSWDVQLINGTYKKEVARARTFGFLQEIEKLREMGLARGGSLDNAVVISGDHIMNEGGLRYENEFVRHKILDSIGDLYLAGAPIIGRFSGQRAGHALTLRLLRSLFANEEAWEWCEIKARDLDKSSGAHATPDRAVAAPI